jgi:MoaD family protein
MEIIVRIFGELSEILGNRHELEVEDDSNVGVALNKLVRLTGQKEGYFGEYRIGGADVAILVNGRNIELLEGLMTPIKDDDEIVILIPTSGG